MIELAEDLGLALETEPLLRTGQGIFAENFYRDLAAGGFLLGLKYRALATSMDLPHNGITGNGPIQSNGGSSWAIQPLNATCGAREHFDLMSRRANQVLVTIVRREDL